MHLEILLQEQLISRRRLAAFAPGKVLPLAPDVIHCVEVRVNGQLLALGELVQLEDRLGVELHEVYSEWAPGAQIEKYPTKCFRKSLYLWVFSWRAAGLFIVVTWAHAPLLEIRTSMSVVGCRGMYGCRG
jgi:type III secretion protein Q